jgi:hypothetical protein
MKKNDFFVLLILFLVAAAFSFIPGFYKAYNGINQAHGMVMSFVKFAVLATFGEMLALRIRTGQYNRKGFGILPRAIVWGILGLTIKMAFVIFATGTPVFLEYMGVKGASTALQMDFSLLSLFTAFGISAAMNLIYAPVMMTLHKITDTHIIQNGGTLAGFFRPIRFRAIFKGLDWETQWNFVFKKTIPFFWIPAHTITFLLPTDFQVLFAALLGIALGVILSFATLKDTH